MLPQITVTVESVIHFFIKYILNMQFIDQTAVLFWPEFNQFL